MPAECGTTGTFTEAVTLIAACIAKRSVFWSCSGDRCGALTRLFRCRQSLLIVQRWGNHQRRCRVAGWGTLQPKADPDNHHGRSFRTSSGWQRQHWRRQQQQQQQQQRRQRWQCGRRWQQQWRHWQQE